MKIRTLYWVLWAILGLSMEFFALANDVPNDTLTGTVTAHLPAWGVFAGLGWAAWHFIASYLNGKEER